MADLSRVKKSKNFEDRTGGRLIDDVMDVLNRIVFPILGPPKGNVLPSENDEYVKRAESLKNIRPGTDYMKMTVSDFTPEEWKLIRENGFGLNDIMLMRDYRATPPSERRKKFMEEEDGSLSKR